MLLCFTGSQTHPSEEPIREKVDSKPKQSYLVPTPLVVASSSTCSVFRAKPGVPPDKNLCSKPQLTPSSNKSGNQHNYKPQVPLEVNVGIPPSTKPRDYPVRTAEGPLPRGPLSYEALVHLRRSASTKKTPLCPTVDHTIDLDKHSPVIVEGPNHSEASKSKMGPPVVAPKPKRIPANISAMTQNEACLTSDSSYSVKHATDPNVVRLEALQKLGLLNDQQPENEAAAHPKSQSSLDPTPNRFVRGPANINPSRSPSFCYSQMSTEPKTKPLQSSASFHHYSRRDQQSASASYPDQPSGSKAAGLERSTTLDNHRNGGYCPEPRHIAAAEPVKTTAAPPVPHKPSNSVGYTVMVVPGMGADRKEALRKLGLLKD